MVTILEVRLWLLTIEISCVDLLSIEIIVVLASKLLLGVEVLSAIKSLSSVVKTTSWSRFENLKILARLQKVFRRIVYWKAERRNFRFGKSRGLLLKVALRRLRRLFEKVALSKIILKVSLTAVTVLLASE